MEILADNELEALKKYIEAGVSPYHVVRESKRRLREAGYRELAWEEDWVLEQGRGYYVAPYASSLYAFYMGDEKLRLLSAHTDQPVLRLKLKPTIDREGNYVANVEAYGGMILHTWFDRPLALAGKVICCGDDPFSPRELLYDSGKPVAVVPSLAIHMDREVNKKNELKVQENLLPLIGLKSGNTSHSDQKTSDILDYVADGLGVAPEDILDYDLTFYNPQEPQTAGMEQELLVSPRLDNLTSCYSAVEAMVSKLEGTDIGSTAVMALFDHEEVGSRTKQGADSSLLAMIFDKIENSLGSDNNKSGFNKYSRIKNGFFLSLDVAHAYHPNYPGKSDITTKTLMGGGVVLKTSGSQRYNSDSYSNGIMIQLCREKGIKLQRQINHSDIVGGLTLGPIVSSYIPIYGADMGVGILAMHSACETAAVSDCSELTRFARAYVK